MKIFLFAGEASGDLHGSFLIHSLKHECEKEGRKLDLICWGGDLMQSAGAELRSHYKDRAYMGLWEVIKNLRSVKKFLDRAKVEILQEKPDVLLLIDNPGFNLRLAQFAKDNGIKVHFYIAPKAWAYNKGRIKTMRIVIDQLYCIFPFEKQFFADYGMESIYVGNPLMESIQRNIVDIQGDLALSKNMASEGLDGTRYIVLLPGSRKNEVRNLLPVFVRTAKRFKGAKVIVAAAPGLDEAFYRQILEEEKLEAEIIFGATCRLLLQFGDGKIGQLNSPGIGKGMALVASGTATLEAALLGIPMVVAYKVSWLTYGVLKRILKIRWVSLVNILLQKPLVEEHIQFYSEQGLYDALLRTQALENQIAINEGYQCIRDMLKNVGGVPASILVARGVLGISKK